MELVLPLNHVELEQEEMMYLDGGWSRSQNKSASAARDLFRRTSAAASVGIAVSLILGVVGSVIGKIFAVVAGSWLNNVRTHASRAHTTAVGIVSRHGANQRVRVTLSGTWLGTITGMSVRTV